LRHGAPEYSEVSHRNVNAKIFEPFSTWKVTLKRFSNAQELDREAFIGRLLSSSYVPLAGERGHREIIAAAERLFDENAVKGTVSFAYETLLTSEDSRI